MDEESGIISGPALACSCLPFRRTLFKCWGPAIIHAGRSYL